MLLYNGLVLMRPARRQAGGRRPGAMTSSNAKMRATAASLAGHSQGGQKKGGARERSEQVLEAGHQKGGEGDGRCQRVGGTEERKVKGGLLVSIWRAAQPRRRRQLGRAFRGKIGAGEAREKWKKGGREVEKTMLREAARTDRWDELAGGGERGKGGNCFGARWRWKRKLRGHPRYTNVFDALVSARQRSAGAAPPAPGRPGRARAHAGRGGGCGGGCWRQGFAWSSWCVCV